MNYVSYAERVGREEGLQEGLQAGLATGRAAGLLEGIALALDIKFPAASEALLAEIRQLSDLGQLEAITQAIRTATTPDDVRRVYQAESR